MPPPQSNLIQIINKRQTCWRYQSQMYNYRTNQPPSCPWSAGSHHVEIVNQTTSHVGFVAEPFQLTNLDNASATSQLLLLLQNTSHLHSPAQLHIQVLVQCGRVTQTFEMSHIQHMAKGRQLNFAHVRMALLSEQSFFFQYFMVFSL